MWRISSSRCLFFLPIFLFPLPLPNFLYKLKMALDFRIVDTAGQCDFLITMHVQSDESNTYKGLKE